MLHEVYVENFQFNVHYEQMEAKIGNERELDLVAHTACDNLSYSEVTK